MVYGLLCFCGKYCFCGKVLIDCFMYRYRDIVGGKDLNDCFFCLVGYWCNFIGMVNYNNSECLIGYFCLS